MCVFTIEGENNFSNAIADIIRPCAKPGMTVKHSYVEIMCQSYLSRISNRIIFFIMNYLSISFKWLKSNEDSFDDVIPALHVNFQNLIFATQLRGYNNCDGFIKERERVFWSCTNLITPTKGNLLKTRISL